MKTSIIYLVIGLLVINSLSAQVKIGNNPQNLDPASILELQSTNRVLVITRVNDTQMNGITPLPGAVVYNTDQGCLHYYNGTEWINICEELDNSFTTTTLADYLSTINPQARDSTVVVTTTENPDGSTNYNFEVGQITGANIVNTSINGNSKLQNESVTNDKLADDAVAVENLADATNAGDLYMYNGSAWSFINRADLLNTQLDSIVGNEVVDATLNGSLVRNGAGSTAAPYTLDVADGGIDTDELSDDAVTNAKLNANVVGAGLTQAADGSLEVDNSTIEPDWTNISSIPLDIADGDDNTQLTNAEVATAVNNEFPDLDTDSTDDFDGQWSSLTGVPAGFDDDIDNDTTLASDDLTQTAVDRTYNVGIGGTLSFTNGSVGVGTAAAPTSTLQTGGSFATAIDRLDGPINLDQSNHTVIIIADSNITFPNVASFKGRIYIIKNPSFLVATDNYIALDGTTANSIAAGETITIQSDGVEWQQIN